MSGDALRVRLQLALRIGLVLSYAAGIPVVNVGQLFKGQETVDGIESGEGSTASSPLITAYPNGPLQDYTRTAIELNLLRAFAKGGFADLEQLHQWNRDDLLATEVSARYEKLATDVERALKFMAAARGGHIDQILREVDFYISRDAGNLAVEESVTRADSISGRWFDCLAHWVAMPEALLTSDAHIEFLSGIENPILCHLGAGTTSDQALRLCAQLNPDNEPGRLAFAAGFGRRRVLADLAPIVEAVVGAGCSVAWLCDPISGNKAESGGLQELAFADILGEVDAFFELQRWAGARPGGLFFELETNAGAHSSRAGDDTLAWDHEGVGPRLTQNQATRLAFHVAGLLQQGDAAESI